MVSPQNHSPPRNYPEKRHLWGPATLQKKPVRGLTLDVILLLQLIARGEGGRHPSFSLTSFCCSYHSPGGGGGRQETPIFLAFSKSLFSMSLSSFRQVHGQARRLFGLHFAAEVPDRSVASKARVVRGAQRAWRVARGAVASDFWFRSRALGRGK